MKIYNSHINPPTGHQSQYQIDSVTETYPNKIHIMEVTPIKDNIIEEIRPEPELPKKLCGRPKKLWAPAHHPTYLKFLSLFGLKSWDDTTEWTQAQLIDSEAVSKYFKMKDEILKLNFPRYAIKKIQIQNEPAFIAKDLITLLSQFGKLFGYIVKSQNRNIKPSSKNTLKKPKNWQVYYLSKYTAKPAILANAPLEVITSTS